MQQSPKLAAARELIKEKHYPEARSLLQTMPGDPTAEKWLIQLDKVAPPVVPLVEHQPITRINPLLVLSAAGIIGAAIIIAAIIAVGHPQSVALVSTMIVVPSATHITSPTAFPTNMTIMTAIQTSIPTDKPLDQLGNWSVSTEVSKLDNVLTVTLDISDDTYSRHSIMTDAGFMRVTCVGDKLNLSFNAGSLYSLDISSGNDTSFRYKFDDQAVQTIPIGKNYISTAFDFPSPEAMLQNMQQHKTMTIGFTPYTDTERESTFNLVGLSAALQPMRGHCGQ